MLIAASVEHRIGGLCQSEVEQLDTSARQHDVARLQIAIDDVLAMSGIERSRDGRAIAGDLTRRRYSLRRVLRRAFVFHLLTGNVEFAKRTLPWSRGA